MWAGDSEITRPSSAPRRARRFGQAGVQGHGGLSRRAGCGLSQGQAHLGARLLMQRREPAHEPAAG